MATKAKKESAIETVSLTPDDPNIPRPRLHKLLVKNFRAIGPSTVEIELDDIVVLVGPNNVGKSSLLRAYEVVMKQGSNDGKLTIEDFPNGIVDHTNLPEIELQTVVFDNAPGARWLAPTADGACLIREQWIWTSPNTNPQRKGFDVEKNQWDEQVPWGAPNIANSRRPRPHRIEAFSSPDAQAKEIVDLLLGILKDKLKLIKTSGEGEEKSDYELLLEKITAFQLKVVDAALVETTKIEDEISSLLERVFPGYKIKLDAKAETDVEKSFTPFKTAPDLLIGPTNGFQAKFSQQGSGARRTLLWAALRYLSETSSSEADSRPHVLLLDEPEICLHPTAVREACNVLYSLPLSKNWQVMITTHSPVFIDLAKDNTTVIRVERQTDNFIHSTTLYRPTNAKLDDDDRANLKALNSCDPYVNEFFFGGPVVLVEGDTEYTAFSLLKNLYPEKYRNLHVVRARGKGSILTIIKILRQFSATYAVLHDADTPLTSAGKQNASWSLNTSIANAIKLSAKPEQISHIVSIKDFELAMFGQVAKSEKPYNTLVRLEGHHDLLEKACLLLDALLDSDKKTPDGFERWTSIDKLNELVEAKTKST